MVHVEYNGFIRISSAAQTVGATEEGRQFVEVVEVVEVTSWNGQLSSTHRASSRVGSHVMHVLYYTVKCKVYVNMP